jgi:hypothetical protein
VGVSLAVIVVVATLGSFAAGFGVMTDCTSTYSCTDTGCSPCATAQAWLTSGWVLQGVLLLLGTGLAVLGARGGIRARQVRLVALLLAAVSVGLFALTTGVAGSSF